jgi:hypothetical protein
VGGGVFGQLAEELEELLAAPGFVVELHQQAALGPHLVAPRGVGGGFVEEGAQGVPGGDQVFVGHAVGLGFCSNTPMARARVSRRPCGSGWWAWRNWGTRLSSGLAAATRG